MTRILFMCQDAVLAAVFLFPLLFLLNKFYFHNSVKTLYYFVFTIYLSAMYAVVGLPSVNYIRFSPNYNLVPFAYMFSDYENSFLNVLLFIPLGFFLPLCWFRYKNLRKVLLFGFGVSFSIEILQLFTYRATDINDLMTNTFGTLIGWCAARSNLYCFPSIVPGRKTKELYVVCILVLLVMFFLHPILKNWISSFYY